MTDWVVFKVELDAARSKFRLCGLEVAMVDTNRKMPERGVSVGRLLQIRSRGGKERETGIARAEEGRMVAPDVLVSPFQAQHASVPLNRPRHVAHRQGNMIEPLDVEHRRCAVTAYRLPQGEVAGAGVEDRRGSSDVGLERAAAGVSLHPENEAVAAPA